MKGAVLVVLTVLFACSVLYFAFCILLTVPYAKREAAGESFLFHGAGFVVSAGLLAWGILVLIRNSRGKSG
jgi:hypothetical protein